MQYNRMQTQDNTRCLLRNRSSDHFPCKIFCDERNKSDMENGDRFSQLMTALLGSFLFLVPSQQM